MGYSNQTLVERILAQALTSATPTDLTTPVDLLRIGNTLDTNQVPTDTVAQYIAFADSEIDSNLSSLYITPLVELADFETSLFSNVSEYNDYIITTEAAPFFVRDSVVITDGTHEERHIISDIVDPIDRNVFETEEAIGYAFQAGARVFRVQYPDPVPVTSARLAAAYIYDKYVMAQSSPAQSDYSALLTKIANQSLIDILSGGIILHGQHRIGRAFFNPTLLRQYGLEGASPGGKKGLERL